MADLIDQTLERGLGDAMFTTAVLARLDTDTGLFTWLNAGHPAPLLFRQGRFIKSLDTVPLLPLGIWRSFDPEEHRPTPASEQLQPGDQVLLYTDGVVEARTPTGDLFGVERLIDLVRRNFTEGVSAEESIRRIAMSLLEHQEDQLRDDATLLLLEWVDQAASIPGST
jgi:serine phosphatase RsbU (regulator of sigma subunit)